MKMCFSRCVEVGASNAPIAMAIQSIAGGSQNNEEPQVEQNPRRTFADDWYQDTLSSPVTTSAVLGTFVEAKKCPDCFRQWTQWHAAGPRRSPATVKVTRPQTHDPFFNSGIATTPSVAYIA